MINPLKYEPLAIVSAVRAVLLAAITFGLHLTDAQLIATLFALEVVLTVFSRSQVTSGATLEAMAPATLAKAQNTSEPVKDVVKRLP